MELLKKLAMRKFHLEPIISDFLHSRLEVEKTLCYILADYSSIPDEIRELYVLEPFTQLFWNSKLRHLVVRWNDINIRRLSTIDEMVEALEIADAISSHFSAHLKDEKISKAEKLRGLTDDSPLRILKYVVDLAKVVPPFVKSKHFQ